MQNAPAAFGYEIPTWITSKVDMIQYMMGICSLIPRL